jgi:8-oxo-dGTP pyrophosphatase MutT (NUDIX family)
MLLDIRFGSRISRMKMNKKAAVVAVVRDGKILAISRKPNHTTYGLPGGTLEEFESYEDAAIRETYEEIGYKASSVNEFELVYEAIDVEGWNARVYFLKDPGIEFTNQPGEGHLVWDDWSRLIAGPFRDFNQDLKKILEAKNLL